MHEAVWKGEWEHNYTNLDLGTRWKWVDNSTSRPISLGETFLSNHWIGRLDALDYRETPFLWRESNSSLTARILVLYRLR
jgi:hypothetical protein